MASHQVETQWMSKMQFNSLINGHTIIMDAPPRSGGEDNGPIPKPFLLAAIAGCSGMDVVALLRKSGLSPDDFSMNVTGELSKEAPIQYVAIHIQYIFTATQEIKEAVLQAVADSQERYCGVSSMLKKALPVTWEIIYNKIPVFNNQPGKTVLSIN